MAGQPVELALKLTHYLVENKIRGRCRFPLTMILEPLERCNLACEGYGCIREHEPVIDQTMTVEDCLTAVEECGTARQTVVPRGTWITLLGDAPWDACPRVDKGASESYRVELGHLSFRARVRKGGTHV